MLFFFYFLFIKESNKKYHIPKNIKQHNSFNTDNKSSYYTDYEGSFDTKIGVMSDEKKIF